MQVTRAESMGQNKLQHILFPKVNYYVFVTGYVDLF